MEKNSLPSSSDFTGQTPDNESEQILTRKQRNVLAAQKSRDRKRIAFEKLTDDNKHLKEEVKKLRSKVTQLEEIIAALRKPGNELNQAHNVGDALTNPPDYKPMKANERQVLDPPSERDLDVVSAHLMPPAGLEPFTPSALQSEEVTGISAFDIDAFLQTHVDSSPLLGDNPQLEGLYSNHRAFASLSGRNGDLENACLTRSAEPQPLAPSVIQPGLFAGISAPDIEGFQRLQDGSSWMGGHLGLQENSGVAQQPPDLGYFLGDGPLDLGDLDSHSLLADFSIWTGPNTADHSSDLLGHEEFPTADFHPSGFDPEYPAPLPLGFLRQIGSAGASNESGGLTGDNILAAQQGLLAKPATNLKTRISAKRSDLAVGTNTQNSRAGVKRTAGENSDAQRPTQRLRLNDHSVADLASAPKPTAPLNDLVMVAATGPNISQVQEIAPPKQHPPKELLPQRGLDARQNLRSRSL